MKLQPYGAIWTTASSAKKVCINCTVSKIRQHCRDSNDTMQKWKGK